jgi:hypothetical protein
MPVDLSLKDEGFITLRSGEQAHTMWLANNDGTYDVRYESGWYCPYTKDGKRLRAGSIIHADGTVTTVEGGDRRDIIKVEFIPYAQGMSCGFQP